MRYFILIVLISLGCKTTSKTNQSSSVVEQVLFTEVSKELSEENIKIRLRNTTGNDLIIMKPLDKFIERNVDGNWERVSVLYCDCGGPPCPAPPSERMIEANGVFSFSWDLMVEECKSDANGRTTVKEKAPAGEYRAIYRVKSSQELTQLMIGFSLD